MNELEEIRRKKMEKLVKEIGEKNPSAQNYPKAPITITDENFDQIVQQYPLMVIDNWAPWCFPCRMIAPIIEEMAKDYAGKVVFGKLNTDENQRTPLKFGVMGIPTLLIIKNGKEVDRIAGAVPREYIESKLRRYLHE
ncbi:MAG: thioredoxin [Euryarchaeota archaeon]|nr:thioredoxin [Euryarchaeota archaeon]